jgi:hypothetical protein
VDLDTNDALCHCGKVRGSPKAKANKYHAKTIMYNGVSYDSIFEANYAMHLAEGTARLSQNRMIYERTVWRPMLADEKLRRRMNSCR